MHASAVACVLCGGAKELAWLSAPLGAALAPTLPNMHVLPVHALDVSRGQWHGRPAFLGWLTMPQFMRVVVELGESCTQCVSLHLDMPPPYNPALCCVLS